MVKRSHQYHSEPVGFVTTTNTTVCPTVKQTRVRSYLTLTTHQAGRADQLDGVTQRRLHANASQDRVSLLAQLYILLLTPGEETIWVRRRIGRRTDKGEIQTRSHLILRICLVSFSVYGEVAMMSRRSSRSMGMP